MGMFGGLGPKAKQAKVLYLCRKAGPMQGGNAHVWWTWAKGKASENAVPVRKAGLMQGGNEHIWWTWAKGKPGGSVVLVRKSWPDAMRE